MSSFSELNFQHQYKFHSTPPSAGAVDRLLCRIQGSEDQLCCLRQVINKIYGCIGNTAGVGNTPGVVACLGGKGEGAQHAGSRSSGNAGGGHGNGSGGVNETQLKIFMDQLTKVKLFVRSFQTIPNRLEFYQMELLF